MKNPLSDGFDVGDTVKSHTLSQNQNDIEPQRIPESVPPEISAVGAVAQYSSVQAETPLQPDEINRLWQHGLHEERLFHDRLNYFSGIQVGLLGVFAILYQKEPSLGVFVPLTAVGIAFAFLWLHVQVKHWRYCMHVNARIRLGVSEYARTIGSFATSGRADGLSIARPLTFSVPLLFAATWVALFCWVLIRSKSSSI